MSEHNLEIELYNLKEDIQEENNVADQNPEVIDRIRTIIEREHSIPELERFKMGALGINKYKRKGLMLNVVSNRN